MITVKRLLLRGVTHKALAQASQTSIPYISKILAGKHRPGRDKQSTSRDALTNSQAMPCLMLRTSMMSYITLIMSVLM